MLECWGCRGLVPERRKEPEGLKEQLLERREKREKPRKQLSSGVRRWGFMSRVQGSSGVILWFRGHS